MTVIENLAEYLVFISKQRNVYYRGCSDASYKMLPGIYRGAKGRSLVKYEHDIVREAIASNVNQFVGLNSNFERLTLMQHYGFPTRLLDITENPLVALYFAVSETKKKDGIVSVLTLPSKLIKHYDSDAVSVLSAFSFMEPTKFETFEAELKANISNSSLLALTKRIAANKQRRAVVTLSYFYGNNADSKGKQECIKLLNNTQALDYIVYEIQKEKPRFRNLVDPSHFDNSILCVKPMLNNQRIIAQQGAFLLYGIKNGDKLTPAEIETSNIKVSSCLIKKESKALILRELEVLGITRQRLFPEIEHSARFLVDRYKSKL